MKHMAFLKMLSILARVLGLGRAVEARSLGEREVPGQDKGWTGKRVAA